VLTLLLVGSVLGGSPLILPNGQPARHPDLAALYFLKAAGAETVGHGPPNHLFGSFYGQSHTVLVDLDYGAGGVVPAGMVIEVTRCEDAVAGIVVRPPGRLGNAYANVLASSMIGEPPSKRDGSTITWKGAIWDLSILDEGGGHGVISLVNNWLPSACIAEIKKTRSATGGG
jgi:hypothetical protein